MASESPPFEPRCGQVLAERSVSSRSRIVDFGALSLREQMRLAVGADVLLGLDGTGIANALWMSSGSVLISHEQMLD